MTVVAYLIYAILYSFFLYFAVVGIRYKFRQLKYRKVRKKDLKSHVKE